MSALRKPVTAEETTRIVALVRGGKSYTEVATLVGRSEGTVVNSVTAINAGFLKPEDYREYRARARGHSSSSQYTRLCYFLRNPKQSSYDEYKNPSPQKTFERTHIHMQGRLETVADPFEEIPGGYEEQLRDEMAFALEQLHKESSKDYMVVFGVIFLGKSKSEMGRLLGMSGERARQRYNDGLAYLERVFIRMNHPRTIQE